jgi:hypothetical protein
LGSTVSAIHLLRTAQNSVAQEMVGLMSERVTRNYEHITAKAARTAVDKLEKIRNAPRFVDAQKTCKEFRLTY